MSMPCSEVKTLIKVSDLGRRILHVKKIVLQISASTVAI